jgi:hypothetical protein
VPRRSRSRCGAIVGLNLSPEAERETRQFGEAFAQAGRAMGPALITVAILAFAVYGAIPVALLLLTAFWVRAKRSAPVTAPAA